MDGGVGSQSNYTTREGQHTSSGSDFGIAEVCGLQRKARSLTALRKFEMNFEAEQSGAYGNFPTRQFKCVLVNPDDPGDIALPELKTYSRDAVAKRIATGSRRDPHDDEMIDRQRQMLLLQTPAEEEDTEAKERDMQEWLEGLSLRSATSATIIQNHRRFSENPDGIGSTGAIAAAAVRMKGNHTKGSGSAPQTPSTVLPSIAVSDGGDSFPESHIRQSLTPRPPPSPTPSARSSVNRTGKSVRQKPTPSPPALPATSQAATTKRKKAVTSSAASNTNPKIMLTAPKAKPKASSKTNPQVKKMH